MIRRFKMKKTPKAPLIRFSFFKDDWEAIILSKLFHELIIFPQANENYPLFSLTIEDGIIPKPERYEREHLVKDGGKAYKLISQHQFAYNPMNLRFGALKMHTLNQWSATI